MTIQAQLKWIDGMQFIARAGDGPAVVIDNPESKGGASPMQLVLIGIAGCTAVDVISIMQKKRTNINDFQVNITGERAEEHPRRYTNIRIEYVLIGKGIKPNAVEQAIQLSETKYCSAMASLNARVESKYRIIDSKQ
ncbi:MAG: OsmC family protein [Desulfobacterales bacterium]|jgi:putative redox protein